MKQFESTVTMAASPEQVWSVLADVVRWPEWLPTVTRVEPLDSSSLKIGARYKISQPKLPITVWTVSELTSGSSFNWEAHSPGIRTIATHALAPISSLEVSVTLGVIFSGFFAGAVSLFKGGLTQDYLNREAAALKETLLRLSGPNPSQT